MAEDKKRSESCGLPDPTDCLMLPKEANMDDSSLSMSNSTPSEDSLGKLPKRETWNRKIDFLLACIGFSVGLGNVWRFPYLCYKNGGGAFLIPYFICVAIGGIPLFFLEVALGQFMSQGGIGAWAICPLFQGIGLATTIIVFLLNCYYNIILTWAFYYLFSSFGKTLPWTDCNNEWNTPQCQRSIYDVPLYNVSDLTNQTIMPTVAIVAPNITGHGVDPVTEFWELKVLQISTGIEDMGSIKWDLAACLLLAWIVIYFCIWKGIKTSGKVMYFTATSPYIIMFILMIRGVTLPGAYDGIKFYLNPDWERMKDPQVWVDAGTQIFFSYSISLGTLTALGSYNKFHHNCWKDSIIFALTNSGTSFFAGFVIFSVLGFMAHEQGVGVGDVAESGPGLAFIAYPKAVSQMPLAPFWSVLFFFMIILLGLDSQFVGVEGFVTAVSDQFPNALRQGRRRATFTACVCFVSFLIGLPMVMNGGMYVFQLFDYYSGSRIILIVAFFECIAVAYIYGVNRFYDNLEMMVGYKINLYMKVSWLFTAPVFTLVLFILCVYTYSELTYNRTYIYPQWSIVFGWMMACTSVFMIPITMVYKLIRAEGTLYERLCFLVRPQLKHHQLRECDDLKDLCKESRIENPVNSPFSTEYTLSESLNHVVSAV